jgi:hypothetical protein
MGKIQDMITHLKTFSVQKQVEDIAKIVRSHEEDIVELNQEQMLHGEDSEGGIIGKYSNPEYAAEKEALNPKAGGNVDLKLAGGFQREMFLKGTSFPFNVDSTDSKRDKLIGGDGYGEKAFGLNAPSKTKLDQDVLKEDIQDYYKSSVFKL